MSRDKLLCPVPSRDKITFPKEQKNRKRTFQNRKKAFQNRKKDVLKQEKDVLKQKRMFQNRKRCSKTGNHRKKFHFINVFSLNSVPRDVPGRDGTSCQNPVPSRPVAKFWACPVVPLSRDKEEISVPLSRKVALSRPVGNPTLESRINNLFLYSGHFVISRRKHQNCLSLWLKKDLGKRERIKDFRHHIPIYTFITPY